MAMGEIPSFSQSANLARVAEGWKGGPFFNNPNTPPPMNFVEGWPAVDIEKMMTQEIPQPTPTDTWFSRNTMKK